MPRQPRATEDHMKNIIACLKPAIALLQEVQDAFATPFVQAILNTTISLATAIQNVKKNKDKCIQLTEHVHQVLYALVDLHVKSETPGSLPPATLDHVGKFMEYGLSGTMHKICTFVEAQGGNRIKSFFRQSEITSLLKDCQTGMQHALVVFGVGVLRHEIHIPAHCAMMTAEKLQEELLDLISSFSCGTTSDRASSLPSQAPFMAQNLSKKMSFAMLPAKPKIFHGRESELTKIIQMFTQDYVRVSILGAGGMGKSSLAKAILHHPEITAKYENRFFVPCDAASTTREKSNKPIIQYFSGQPASFLILDNLETAWEPLSSRNSVEELLSLLTDINNLALLITMWGAERPAKVRWNRPFLPPLEPLYQPKLRETYLWTLQMMFTTRKRLTSSSN
ncbi:hypothetical protein B0H14DRAFT_2607708 [Mycena olivaceomarginata]|nr:hypothetical protein B0H14DRAFT_2607708 [Mycena olivaceomarginata]